MTETAVGTTEHSTDPLTVLERTWGFSEFRPLQREVIDAILAGHDALALMPTGGGKSVCYQIPALITAGTTIVVSPLIALMKDQVDALNEVGVAATFINSSLTPGEIAKRSHDAAAGQVKLMYVAPERAVLPSFVPLLQSMRPSLFAVDEAHCISEWGHDFRPEYRQLRTLRDRFPEVPMAAFTATATEQVQADIVDQLGLRDPRRFIGSFNRPNLHYRVIPKVRAYGEVLDHAIRHPDASGIIYVGSRAQSDEIASKLRKDGVAAAPYHAGLEDATRRRNQEAFIRDRVRVVVATVAFGMGINKPDVRFVIHYDTPKNLESYYQESGRAGRDGQPADCLLLYSSADVARLRFWIEQKPAGEQAIASRQLAAMCAWAETSDCRRISLVAYFGEELQTVGSPCCDNCDGASEQQDLTIEAKKLLACARRTGERFGASYLADVLRGSRAVKVLQNQHDKTTTYGIGSELSKDQWVGLANLMKSRGMLAADSFGSLRVTAKGEDILFGREHFTGRMSQPRVRSQARLKQPATGPQEELYEELRAVRRRLADERDVPPYVILSNQTIREVASALPRSLETLRSITGIGDHRVQEYGEIILDTVRRFIRSHPENSLTDSQLETLEMLRSGASIAEIARARGIVPSTVRRHIVPVIESGVDVDLSLLVDISKSLPITEAFQRLGMERLTPVKEALGESYSYEDLDFVRAYLRGQMAREQQTDSRS